LVDVSTEAETTWRSEVLLRELRRQARSIVGVAESLEQLDDYATRTPPLLCQLIRETADVVVKNIDACPSSQLQHLGVLLGLMGEHLRYVERSQVAHTPWSMVEAVEAFMGRYVVGNVAFIIRPQWSYNYANESQFVASYRKWIEAFTFIPEDRRAAVLRPFDDKQIYLISFPRVERLNALLHCAWAHELGHTIAATWLNGNFNRIWSVIGQKVDEQARKDLEPAVNDAQQDLFARTRLEGQVARIVRQAMECTKQALTELIADAFALHVLGPAWFSAASEIASRSELDSPPISSAFYPPWRYRLRLMSKHLQPDLTALENLQQQAEVAAMHAEGGYATALFTLAVFTLVQAEAQQDVETKAKVASEVARMKAEAETKRREAERLPAYVQWLRTTLSILETREDEAVINRDLGTSIAYKEIEGQWETIRSTALDSISKYDFITGLPIILELVDRLQNQIPPNEHGKWPNVAPASFEDVLNAGWIQKLRVVRHTEAIEEIAVLNQLVLKAVEVSHLQRVYGKELAT